jgi:hypothetical protein
MQPLALAMILNTAATSPAPQSMPFVIDRLGDEGGDGLPRSVAGGQVGWMGLVSRV